MASIQGIYIALFGRPADPGGLAYWTGVTKNGTDLSQLIGQLTAAPEYTTRFAGKTPTEVVTSIYQSLFGRAPESAGLDFFVNGLQNGTFKIESLAISILDGAQGADRTAIANKIAAADLFTSHLDLQIELDAYRGTSAADIGRTFLTKVTVDPLTLPPASEVDRVILTLLNPSGGQEPGGGDGSNNGGNTGGQLYTNSYGNLSANAQHAPNELFAGHGNPANGFVLSQYAAAHLELGLDVRYNLDPSEVAPTSGSTFSVDVRHQDDVRFAYSISSSDGNGSVPLDLTNYDFRLSIDTDPTAGTNFVELKLVADAGGNPYSNNGNSQFDWVLASDGTTPVIIDDGGDAAGSVTQNIQKLQWYNGSTPLHGGDNYQVKLDAYLIGTTTLAAHSEITIDVPTINQTFAQGFETNSDGILTAIGGDAYGSVDIEDSGDNGIAAYEGSHYAVFKQVPASGPDATGPFTKFDGYRTDKPTEVTSQIAIYLDSSKILDGEGFGYSVAANGQNGNHLRDFVFNVVNDGGQLYIGSANGSTFDPPTDTSGMTAVTGGAGWYVFQQQFHEDGTGKLEVDFTVTDSANNVVYSAQNITTDVFDSVYGGNRYGWFTNIDVTGGIAVDNVSLAAIYS